MSALQYCGCVLKEIDVVESSGEQYNITQFDSSACLYPTECQKREEFVQRWQALWEWLCINPSSMITTYEVLTKMKTLEEGKIN